MMLTSNLQKGTFVRYGGRLHQIKSASYKDGYTYLLLKGVYLPITKINLIMGPGTTLEVVHPDCNDYHIESWKHGNLFQVIRTDLQGEPLTIAIPDRSKVLSQAVALKKDIKINLCYDNGTYEIYSII